MPSFAFSYSQLSVELDEVQFPLMHCPESYLSGVDTGFPKGGGGGGVWVTTKMCKIHRATFPSPLFMTFWGALKVGGGGGAGP